VDKPREPGRQAAGLMPEAELQAAVVKLCKVLGVRWHHHHYSIGSKAGWPDLVLVGRGILFRELKREGKDPTPAQAEWGDWLAAGGGNWAVWRPSDLHSGLILRELEAIR
jgi:hypothetical protein